MNKEEYKERLEGIRDDFVSSALLLKRAVVGTVLMYREINTTDTQAEAVDAVVDLLNEAIDIAYVPEFLEDKFIRKLVVQSLEFIENNDLIGESVDDIVEELDA